MEVYNYFEKRISRLELTYKIKKDYVKFNFNKTNYSTKAPYDVVEDRLRAFIDFIYTSITDEFKAIYSDEDFNIFCKELNEHLDILEMDLLAIDYIDLHAAKYTNMKSARKY